MKGTSFGSRALASVVGTMVSLGSLLLLCAVTVNAGHDALLFAVADNLLIAGAVLSLFLALARIEESPVILGDYDYKVMMFPATSAISATIAATIVRYGGFRAYEFTVALLVGLGVALLPFVLAEGSLIASTEPLSRRALLTMHFLLLPIIISGILLRYAAPGSDLLTWVIAPIYVFMVPGMSLGAALHPASTRWLERLCWGPPLSLAAQLISLMWLNWLAIPTTIPVFFLISGVFTLIGFWVVAFRRGEREALPG